jgi:UDP-N-acetylglucosamine:LPS N-acetylglucosamine transferase
MASRRGEKGMKGLATSSIYHGVFYFDAQKVLKELRPHIVVSLANLPIRVTFLDKSSLRVKILHLHKNAKDGLAIVVKCPNTLELLLNKVTGGSQA